jgi:hypothetical protein
MLKVTTTTSSDRGVSFAEHAIKILDHMMKDRSVSEVLKLGPREEMVSIYGTSLFQRSVTVLSSS